MNEVPYRRPTNIRRQRKKFSLHGDLAPRICEPLIKELKRQCHLTGSCSFQVTFDCRDLREIRLNGLQCHNANTVNMEKWQTGPELERGRTHSLIKMDI